MAKSDIEIVPKDGPIVKFTRVDQVHVKDGFLLIIIDEKIHNMEAFNIDSIASFTAVQSDEQ